MIGLLEGLETGKHWPPALKQTILGHLKKCSDAGLFARFLPNGTVLAHKTGLASGIRADAGLLYLPDAAVALCVLTAGEEDPSDKADHARSLLCAEVAKIAFDYFNESKQQHR
jgi:hypothetical protein